MSDFVFTEKFVRHKALLFGILEFDTVQKVSENCYMYSFFVERSQISDSDEIDESRAYPYRQVVDEYHVVSTNGELSAKSSHTLAFVSGKFVDTDAGLSVLLLEKVHTLLDAPDRFFECNYIDGYWHTRIVFFDDFRVDSICTEKLDYVGICTAYKSRVLGMPIYRLGVHRPRSLAGDEFESDDPVLCSLRNCHIALDSRSGKVVPTIYCESVTGFYPLRNLDINVLQLDMVENIF